MYNKEQFRKELEDCWDASNDSFWWHTVANNDRPEPPDKSTYITIRLAALGDELVYTPIEPLDPTLPQATSKRADDGQEGKGLDSKKILQNTLNGAWEEIRRLRALLETDSTGNELLRSIYQICERKGENTNWEAITKKIQERLAALPVADGKGELFITNESIKAGNEMANKLFAEDDKEFHVPDGEGEKVGEWQLCPKCNGDGNLLRYNPPAMMGTNANPICDVCNGGKILPKPLLPSAVMGGVKWVKASERLPTEPGDYFVKVDFSTHIGNDCIDFNGEEFDSGNVIEWLSEGQPE